MTNQEIIERLRMMKAAWIVTADTTPESQETAAWAAEAINGAISALKGPTREQVEKMKASVTNVDADDPYRDYGHCAACGEYVAADNFCSVCGTPFTNEAVDMMMKRLEEVLKGACD